MFKRADQDKDGVINEVQFRDLMFSLGFNIDPSELESSQQNSDFSVLRIERFLQIIDPYSNQKITFSDCVHLLSSEMVTVPENSANTD